MHKKTRPYKRDVDCFLHAVPPLLKNITILPLIQLTVHPLFATLCFTKRAQGGNSHLFLCRFTPTIDSLVQGDKLLLIPVIASFTI